MRPWLVLAASVLVASACCASASAPPPSSAAAPPPSSPEQPILSPGACSGDDRTGLPLATSDFRSTLPLGTARARLDEWNEWCPDTACEGSFDWYAYDLRGDAARSEVTMRTYSMQRAPVPDLTAVTASGRDFQARVLAQHMAASCIVPCLEQGVYEPTASPCLVLDVRFTLELPVPADTTTLSSRWDETLVTAGIALEGALRAQAPEDFGP